MNRKTCRGLTHRTLLALCIAVATVLTAVIALVTAEVGVWGGLLGFLAGIAECAWLFRNLHSAMEDELSHVLAQYRKNMVMRWGAVAVFALLVARFFAQGLFFMVIGFALGILVAVLLVIRQITDSDKKKGGEN